MCINFIIYITKKKAFNMYIVECRQCVLCNTIFLIETHFKIYKVFITVLFCCIVKEKNISYISSKFPFMKNKENFLKLIFINYSFFYVFNLFLIKSQLKIKKSLNLFNFSLKTKKKIAIRIDESKLCSSI